VDGARAPGTSIFPDIVSFEAGRVGSGDEFEVAGALDRARCEDEAGFVVLDRRLQARLVRYAAVLVGGDDADDVTALLTESCQLRQARHQQRRELSRVPSVVGFACHFVGGHQMAQDRPDRLHLPWQQDVAGHREIEPLRAGQHVVRIEQGV
jgi:hypothetical protein